MSQLFVETSLVKWRRDGERPEEGPEAQMELHRFESRVTSSAPDVHMPTILCLHGMTECGLVFSNWTSCIPNVRILALNRPGYGRSSEPPTDAPYGFKQFASDVHQVLLGCGIEKVDAVVGHSSGGPNALALAHYLGPDVVNRCILVASDVEYASDAAKGLKDPLADNLDAFLKSPINPDASAEQLGFVTSREKVLLEKSAYRDSVRYNQGKISGVRHDYQIERTAWDFDVSSLKMEGRVCVVIGDQDPFISIDHAKYFQKVLGPQVPVIVKPGYGHFDIVLDDEAAYSILQLAIHGWGK